MEKVMYVLSATAPLEAGRGDELRERLVAIAEVPLRAVSVAVHDTAAAEAPSPAPAPAGERTHAAIVSAWLDCYQHRGAVDQAVDGAAGAFGLDADAYLVVESLYEDYGTTPWAEPRDWPDGARSPGVLTVALLHRPAGLDEAAWLHNWHEVQSPRSGQLQPRCRYVRNRVVQRLTDGAPGIDGIVEEAWASPEVVADPMQFFATGGDPDALGPMVTEMLSNVEACLDLAQLRSTTMSEYLLRSL